MNGDKHEEVMKGHRFMFSMSNNVLEDCVNEDFVKEEKS